MPKTNTALATINDIPPDELSKIVEAGKEALAHQKYFEFTEIGLIIHGDPPFEAWAATVVALEETAKNLPLWVGDLLNAGEARYGQKYSQFLDMRAYGTLRNWAWVCNAVPIERRRKGLLYGHYCAVAPLTPALQKRYLGKAAKENLAIAALKDKLSEDLGLPSRPRVLWQGITTLRHTEEGLACILWMPGDLVEGMGVSVVVTEIRLRDTALTK